MESKVLNENANELKVAIEEGIGAPAVESTLNDIISKSDSSARTPIQLKDTIGTIVEMKSDIADSKTSNNYASQLVRDNEKKIEEALNNGISPNEVSNTLINNVENPKKGKKHLRFIVKLISKMKKKELKLNINKENGKSYQKIKK